MTITFSVPITQTALAVRRLVNFGANIITHTIVCDFQTGYLDVGGAFVPVGPMIRSTFTDDTTPSFNAFIAACPAAGALRRQIEQYEVTLDRAGSVD